MATDSKMLSLIQSLSNATTEDRLNWSNTYSRDLYTAKTKNASISMSSDMSSDGEMTYLITLCDEKTGNIIEDAYFSSDDVGHDFAAQLYQLARRKAYKVDRFIDSVIAELGGS